MILIYNPYLKIQIIIQQMGCGPSNQVHTTIVTPVSHKQVKKQETVKEITIVQQKKQEIVIEKKQQNVLTIVQQKKPIIVIQQKKKKVKQERNSFCFLFGETSAQRKIICFDSKQLNFSTISSKTKIQQPPLKYQPAQVIYEESQQLYSSNLFTHNSHPPYNFMLAISIDSQKIFLCGGVNFDFDYISSESFYFDTQSDISATKNKLGHNLMGTKFEKLPFMHYKRFSHMGVYMSVNSVKYIYVFGGRSQNDEILCECQRFNLAQRKWKKIAPMNIRRSTGFTFIFKNKIYLFGGYSGNKKRPKKIEVYYPDKDYWETLNIKLHRGLETGLVYSVRPNQIIIIGGNLQYGAVKSVFRANLQQQTYIYETEMKHQRVLQKGCQTNTQIIVFGGNFSDGLQIFNLKEKRWRQNQTSYTSHISADDINSFSFSSQTVYVEDQQIQPSKNQINTDQKYCLFSNDQSPCIMELNITKSIWKKKSVPMNLRLRSFMGAAIIKSGKYFLCGGINQYMEKSTRSTYIYYINTNNCVEQQKMLQPRYSFGICKMEEYVYVFGGKKDEAGSILSACQKFDIQNNKWQKCANMNRQRHSCLAIPIGSKIYIIGGADSLQKIQQIEVYDTLTDKFTSLSQQNRFCLENGLYTINNSGIYIFGGLTILGQNHNIIKLTINKITQKQIKQQKEIISNEKQEKIQSDCTVDNMNEVGEQKILMFNTLDNVGHVSKIVNTNENGIYILKKNKTLCWKDNKFEQKILINQIQLGPLQLDKLCIA